MLILFLVVVTTHLEAVAGLGCLDFERLLQRAEAEIPRPIFTQTGRYTSAALFDKLVTLFFHVCENQADLAVFKI